MPETMSRRGAIGGAIAGIVLGATDLGAADPPGADGSDHCKWLARIIREVESVKVGMTRKDVEKVLQEEVGGLVQRRKSLRFQHPDCSYVKLIVTFEAAKEEKDDKVVGCSTTPFLDLVPNTKRF